ncbi:hypothetical protein JTB14_028750 [Gonioctena quinquepunctata]|nr:hypothetical protein JTB14_028750 [Gonioctena quinquepunctata]
MDQRKFVNILKQYPVIWDRSHPNFRDKDIKDNAWVSIANALGWTDESCKETFKAIREKYVREREKAAQPSISYREWDLLSDLKFLDPNIVPRKTGTGNESDLQRADKFCSQIIRDILPNTMNQTDIDRALIALVKKTTSIWDRNCNTYPNKQLKNQLWENIAGKLNMKSNACQLKWKALREKYIRQKIKFQQEGEKWELLDDMSFLDKVIQYRKKLTDDIQYQKPTNFENQHNSYSTMEIQSAIQHQTHESDSSCSQTPYTYDENSLNEFSNDFSMNIKEENTVIEVADSSYYSNALRKRSTSTSSEVSPSKKPKCDDTRHNLRAPEELFGDLVAAMLARKPEKDRNLYMIEIMTVLSK